MQTEDLRRQQAMMQSDAGQPFSSAFAHAAAPRGEVVAIAPRRKLPKAA